MKVLIAVPTYENITPDTFKSIYDLDTGGHETAFEFVRGYDVAQARNRIGRLCRDGQYDYVLMVDNDVTLPPDALVNLLEHRERVVLGYYAHRDADNLYRGRTCICRLNDAGGRPYGGFPLESEYRDHELTDMRDSGTTLLHIHGGGLGCALIRRDVFDDVRWPWFQWVIYEDGHGTLSEDLSFAVACSKRKIKMFCDPRVACGHLLRHVQWPETGD